MTTSFKIKVRHDRVHRSHMGLILSSLIQSTPQSHDPTDFRLDDKAYNHEQYQFLSGESSTAVTDSGLPLIEEINTYAVVDHIEESIVYLMEFQQLVLGGRHCASQYKLWRDKARSAEKIDGIPIQAYVFNILVDTFDAVVTDRYQTPDGKNFWFGQIDRAFNNGMFVYAIEMDNIKRLHTKAEFAGLKGHIWGDKPEHYNRRVAIAKTEVW